MLIGLAGYAGVGKSSIAKAISERNGFPIKSFAAELKRRVDPLFPPDTPKYIKRDTYVAYGAAMRELDPDCWVNALNPPDDAIIDDVRYRNEVEWIRKRGGVVLLVRRRDVVAANDEEEDSFSEMPMLPTVYNNTTIIAARDEVFAMLFTLTGERYDEPERVILEA